MRSNLFSVFALAVVFGTGALSAGALGCSKSNPSTPANTKLIAWDSVASVTDAGSPVTESLTAKSGTVYRVTARFGSTTTSDGTSKKLAATVTIELVENPNEVEVSAVCSPATHFAGQPLDVLRTICTVDELKVKEGVTGTESSIDRQQIFVNGDGSIAIEAL